MSKMIGDATTPFPGLTHQSQKGRNMVKLFFFFIHTKFVEIFTEISAESPLYQEVSSYTSIIHYLYTFQSYHISNIILFKNTNTIFQIFIL